MKLPTGTGIREMRRTDLERVIAIERETFPTPWPMAFFSSELEKGPAVIYLVAEVSGALVGYIGSQLLGRELHVTNIAVAEPRRRCGIGTALVLDCLERALPMGVAWMTLEVRQGNTAALAFYRRFGLEELGTRRGYYYDTGEDALLLATMDVSELSYREILNGIRGSLAEGGDR